MFPKEMIPSAEDLFKYLLVIMDRQNIAIAPTVEIEERIGMSESSICRGRIQLLNLDFIRQRGPGLFMVNPAKSCKVDGDKRAELFSAYSELKHGGKVK